MCLHPACLNVAHLEQSGFSQVSGGLDGLEGSARLFLTKSFRIGPFKEINQDNVDCFVFFNNPRFKFIKHANCFINLAGC